MAYINTGASASGLAASRWGHAGPHALIGAILASIVLVLRPLPPVNPPGTAAKYRPDAEIRLAKRAFVGRGSYDVSHQRVTSQLNGRRAKTATFEIRVTNRGNAADQMAIWGTPRNAQFTVAYLYGRKNVTAAVLNSGYRSGTLKPGQSATLTVQVTKVKRAKKGSNRTFTIRVASAHDRKKVDNLAAVVKVVRG